MLAGWLALSSLFAGCAVRNAPPPELPEQAREPDHWAAGSTEEPTGPIPEGWVTALGDPQLEALVEEALEHNQTLKTAAAELEVARLAAAKAAAGVARRPSSRWPATLMRSSG